MCEPVVRCPNRSGGNSGASGASCNTRQDGRAMTDRHGLRMLLTAVGVAVAVVGRSSTAGAEFSDSASASLRLSTATLQPPTMPATSPGTCVRAVADTVVVTWTRSVSAGVDGYEILRSTVVTGPYAVVGTVQGNGAQTYTDTSLPFLRTFYYQVRGVRAEWRTDVTSVVSRATRTQGCV